MSDNNKDEPPPAMERCHTCKSDCSEASWSDMKSCWTLVCRGAKKHKHDLWKGSWVREDKRQRGLEKELEGLAATPAAAKEEVKEDTKEEAKEEPIGCSSSSSSDSSSSSSDSDSPGTVKEPLPKKPCPGAAATKPASKKEKGKEPKKVDVEKKKDTPSKKEKADAKKAKDKQSQKEQADSEIKKHEQSQKEQADAKIKKDTQSQKEKADLKNEKATETPARVKAERETTWPQRQVHTSGNLKEDKALKRENTSPREAGNCHDATWLASGQGLAYQPC